MTEEEVTFEDVEDVESDAGSEAGSDEEVQPRSTIVPDLTVDEFEEFLQDETDHGEHLPEEQYKPFITALRDHDAPIEPLAKEILAPYIVAHKDMMSRLSETDPHPSLDFPANAIWRDITDATKKMASQIDRMVELTKALLTVPEKDIARSFAYEMSMELTEFQTGVDTPARNDADRFAIRQAQTNVFTFLAKLSALGLEILDNRLRVGRIFQLALEEEPWTVYHVPDIEETIEAMGGPENEDAIEYRDERLEDRDIRILNYFVPVVATWIEHDGQGLYEFSEPMNNDDVEFDWAEPTTWKGPKGFSKERFSFWRKRFEWVSTITALEHDTRQRAKRAAEQMAKIEGQ